MRRGKRRGGTKGQQSATEWEQTQARANIWGSKNTADDLFLIVCKTGTSASLILLRVATIEHKSDRSNHKELFEKPRFFQPHLFSVIKVFFQNPQWLFKPSDRTARFWIRLLNCNFFSLYFLIQVARNYIQYVCLRFWYNTGKYQHIYCLKIYKNEKVKSLLITRLYVF